MIKFFVIMAPTNAFVAGMTLTLTSISFDGFLLIFGIGNLLGAIIATIINLKETAD